LADTGTMASDDRQKPATNGDDARSRTIAEAGRIAEARSVLAAIERSVFPRRHKLARSEQRQRTVRAVTGLFGHG
jgi:hypothetical protein